jgi:methionyl-tRNA synthetase
MVGKYRDGVTPPAAGASPLAEEGAAMVAAYRSCLDELDISGALDAVWDVVRRLNRHVEEEAPWKLAKDASQAGRLDRVLCDLVAGLRLVAICLHPVMPATAAEILRRLGQPAGASDLLLERAEWDRLMPAAVLAAAPLFPRIEADV